MKKEINEIDVEVKSDDIENTGDLNAIKSFVDKSTSTEENTVTIEEDNDSPNKGLKLNSNKVLSSLGIRLHDRDKEEIGKIKLALNKFLSYLNDNFNTAVFVNEEDENTDSLYDSSDDRGIQYGVQYEEKKFETIMNELANNNSAKIAISENINPKIKKKDLIKFIKQKNEKK